jgi:hypothetical protein
MKYQQVTIWHNSYREDDRSYIHFDGFETGRNLMTPVFTYLAVGDASQKSATAIAADAYEQFNVGEEGVAAQYRALRLRSLSVGDVVQVGRRHLAVGKRGWRYLTGAEVRLFTIAPDPDMRDAWPTGLDRATRELTGTAWVDEGTRKDTRS